MTTPSEFLKKYTILEQVIKASGYDSVKDYEEILKVSSPKDASRLGYCRCARNFLSHEEGASSFVPISDAMVQLVERLSWKLSKGTTPVSKAARPFSEFPSPKSSLSEVMAVMVSKDTAICPVYENGILFGVVSRASLLGALASGAATPKSHIRGLSSIIMKHPKRVPYAEDFLLNETEEGVLYETSKGVYFR